MARLVQALPKGLNAKAAAATGNSSVVKDYLERVAKYVPSEIVAGYTGINAAIANSPEHIKHPVLIANLILCAVFSPVYIALLTDKGEPKLVNQIVSSIAFLIWAYSVSGIDGIFGKSYWNIYDGGLAASFLIFFTIISGAIIPRK
jgi:hypothetical protein